MSIVLLALPSYGPLPPAMPGLRSRLLQHFARETSHPMILICTPAHCDIVASFPLASWVSGFFALKEYNDCGACVKMCPMEVRIPEYIMTGRRVLTTECSLCQTCITVCAKDSLKLSFGFDLGGKDLLRERGQAVPRVGAPATAGK